MAQIGGDDERGVSVELNLVPFIDLMSVCIVFLLLSAVWTQVSMIQIGSSIYGKRTDDEPVKPPPRAEIPLRLDVRTDGFQLVVGRTAITIPKTAEGYDEVTLLNELKKVKAQYPDKIDGYVTVPDELEYDLLIKGMDAMIQAGFPEVTIPTGGAQASNETSFDGASQQNSPQNPTPQNAGSQKSPRPDSLPRSLPPRNLPAKKGV